MNYKKSNKQMMESANSSAMTENASNVPALGSVLLGNGLVLITLSDLRSVINEEVKAAIRQMEKEGANADVKTAFEAYYTPSELARKWGVTTGTLWSYQNKGIITPIHKENRVYYDKNVIDNMENPRYSRKIS